MEPMIERTPSSGRGSRRSSWHRRAGRPVQVWFAAIIVAAFIHPFLDDGRWLLVHLFTLGAVTNSILVWSRHFTERLLKIKVPDESRRPQLLRIYLLNAGIVIIIVGKLGDWWLVTTVGAALVGLAVAWHAVSLGRDLHAGRGQRFAVTVTHYVASACLLPVGAVFGALLASPVGDSRHDGLLLAHETVNILGFLGLAASGTLLTLFPAMWRTRLSPQSHPTVSLYLQLAGITVTTVAALAGWPPAASAGLAMVTLGWIVAAVPWARNVLTVAKEPRARLSYPALSAAAAVVWLIATLLVATFRAGTSGFTISTLTLPLLMGFGAQLLIGVMSWLLPSTIGGGARAVSAGMAELDRAGAFRWAVINLGLALWLLPLDSWLKVMLSAMVGLAYVSFLPLMVRAAKAQVRTIRSRGQEADVAAGVPPEKPADSRRLGRQTTAAVAVVTLVTVVGLALVGGDTGAGSRDASVAPTGKTVEVTVAARDMAFEPDTISADPGDRLVITLVNEDTQVHDLRFETGEDTGRVSPGDSATLEVDIVPGDLDGWCTIAGHRQQGMTLTVDTDEGASSDGDTASGSDATGGHDHGAPVGVPASDSPTINPALAPAEDTTVHRVTLRADEFIGYAAPGVEQEHWGYNGKPLGPTLRGKVGDEFIVTVVNDGTMSHSVDFHAGMVSPDGPMRDLAPGESLEYRFTAEHSGIWLYHCATEPMSSHIAGGMHGAVIIDPPDLPEVDHELLMVESEGYWGDNGPDAAKIMDREPDAFRFNGYPGQYLAHPVRIRSGETVRFWVLAAGPDEGTSFHVVGTQFHRVYKEGSLVLDDGDGNTGGAQTLDLAAAQGGYADARFPEAGTYTFVDHQMVNAEMGARGHVIVE